MGIHRGPNTVKDGLVFGYDTGYGVADNETGTRFYPGAPTTNLNTDPYHSTRSDGDTLASAAWGGDSGSAEFKTNTSPDGGGLMYINKNTSNPVGSGGVYNDFPSTRFTLTNGVTYTRSWWCKSNINQTLSGHICSCNRDSTNTYIVGSNISLTTDWQRITETFTYSGPTSTDWQFRHINYNASEVYIANVQLEAHGFATPFIDGSRSSTESLIDLKRTTDIDVSNVSFDSTGQPTFDGTDDYIQIPDPNISSLNGFSIEMIIKPTNASSSPMVITPNSGGIDHFVRFSSNGRLYMRMVIAPDSSVQDFTTTTSLSSTEYHYVVFTFRQSEGGKAYYNGSQESAASANFTALDWSSFWKIGQRGNNTFFFDGEIPILKIHNQALTASEIKQNYNAYKNRFNL